MAVDYVLKKVSELKPAPYNPRHIDDANRKALKNSIERFGVVQPIIWNKKTGHVVGGNQRLSVLIEKKVKETQVVVVDLTLEKEKELNIALNNRGMEGVFTRDVQDLLEEIKLNDLSAYDSLRFFEIEKDVSEQVVNPDEDVTEVVGPPDMELHPYEHYDYVFIVVNDVRDWNWLVDFLELQKVNASPVGKKKVGLMRGMWFKDFKAKLDKYEKTSP